MKKILVIAIAALTLGSCSDEIKDQRLVGTNPVDQMVYDNVDSTFLEPVLLFKKSEGYTVVLSQDRKRLIELREDSIPTAFLSVIVTLVVVLVVLLIIGDLK